MLELIFLKSVGGRGRKISHSQKNTIVCTLEPWHNLQLLLDKNSATSRSASCCLWFACSRILSHGLKKGIGEQMIKNISQACIFKSRRGRFRSCTSSSTWESLGAPPWSLLLCQWSILKVGVEMSPNYTENFPTVSPTAGPELRGTLGGRSDSGTVGLKSGFLKALQQKGLRQRCWDHWSPATGRAGRPLGWVARRGLWGGL